DFLLGLVSDVGERNFLCVFRNPSSQPALPAGPLNFELLGYDLVDIQASASALTNCGGFPEVFENSERSSKGLLASCTRALEVQSELRRKYPEEPHADCHVWAILRSVAPEHACDVKRTSHHRETLDASNARACCCRMADLEGASAASGICADDRYPLS